MADGRVQVGSGASLQPACSSAQSGWALVVMTSCHHQRRLQPPRAIGARWRTQRCPVRAAATSRRRTLPSAHSRRATRPSCLPCRPKAAARPAMPEIAASAVTIARCCRTSCPMRWAAETASACTAKARACPALATAHRTPMRGAGTPSARPRTAGAATRARWPQTRRCAVTQACASMNARPVWATAMRRAPTARLPSPACQTEAGVGTNTGLTNSRWLSQAQSNPTATNPPAASAR
jgi:hypothetical protein